MSDRIPVSVFIIAKNEADRIGYTLKSVMGWTDEVYVIDSGSTDETVSISRELGAHVLFNEWPGYGPQKNFGESLCRNKWLLNLDADEEVTPELRASIVALFAGGKEPEKKTYTLSRKLLHFADDSPTNFTRIDEPLRLYHIDYAGFKNSTVHDSVDTKRDDAGDPGKLKGLLLHRCFRSYKHATDKINFYSGMQAEDMFNKGRRPSALRILIEPVYSFFKAYFMRRYFLRGLSGYIESVIYAFGRTLRLAKTRALYIEAEHDKRRALADAAHKTPPSSVKPNLSVVQSAAKKVSSGL